MSVFLKDRVRKVIPRWRDSKTTLITGEADSIGSSARYERLSDPLFAQKLRDWQTNRSLPFAIEVVGAAFVNAREVESEEAARFVISNRYEAPTVALELAERILHSADEHNPLEYRIFDQPIMDDGNAIRLRIHDLRLQSHRQMLNPFPWIDLALQYTILDQRAPALKAMEMALMLAPANRLVLRAAARLLIHYKEFDLAHDTLRLAPTIKKDPWVLGAEVATASLANRTSRLIKRAQRMLDDYARAPLHITELASALGSLEVDSGNNRGARKLFSKALDMPTENSLAQAVWAAKRIGQFEISERPLSVPLSFEAHGIRSFRKKEWRNALNAFKGWLYDQPFSVEPAIIAGFVAATALDDYEESLRLLKFGQIANPKNPFLRLNQVFALASLNRADEAQRVLNDIEIDSGDVYAEVMKLANQGLIYYRRGISLKGQLYYRMAIERASGKSYDRLRAVAATFYAREELLAGSANAAEVKEFALGEAEDIAEPGLIAVREHLVRTEQRVKQSQLERQGTAMSRQ